MANLLQQFGALFKLPGQIKRTQAAVDQSNAVSAKTKPVATVVAPPAPAPAPAPSVPVAPAPGAIPATNQAQIEAIKKQLGVLEPQLAAAKASEKREADTTAAKEKFTTDEAPLRKAEDSLASLAGASKEEINAEKALSNLIASRELGLAGIENKVIPMEFITGQSNALVKTASAKALPLQAQLAALQAKRQAAIDVAKTDVQIQQNRFERARPNEDKISEFTNDKNEKVIVFRDKNTGATRQEVIGGTAPKAATQTDRDRELKTEAIKLARPALIAARGNDGYVDTATYLKMRSDYAEAIGNPKDFDDVFSPMLSPAERERIGLKNMYHPPANDDIGAVLSAYLSGAASGAEE